MTYAYLVAVACAIAICAGCALEDQTMCDGGITSGGAGGSSGREIDGGYTDAADASAKDDGGCLSGSACEMPGGSIGTCIESKCIARCGTADDCPDWIAPDGSCTVAACDPAGVRTAPGSMLAGCYPANETDGSSCQIDGGHGVCYVASSPFPICVPAP